MNMDQDYREELAHVLLECLVDYNNRPYVIELDARNLNLAQSVSLIRQYGDLYWDLSIGEICEAKDQLRKEMEAFA